MSSVELFFESDTENDEKVINLLRRRKQIRDKCNPLDLEEFCFIKNFRLTKQIFVDLLEEIEPKLKPSIRSSSIPTIIKLASFLRFCAQGSYQTGIGNEFNVGLAQPTFSLVLKEMLCVFEQHICPKWINFDYTAEEKNEAKLFFFQKSRISGVIGAADGTHIRIRAPNKNIQHLYYNRKGFYSINALIVCDHNTMIRYVCARYPGACHDSMIWGMSSLKAKLEQDYLNGDRNSWLLGDGGYPLAPYLITPFRNTAENSLEAHFNKNHTQGRIIIERTIGILKNRFRCLLGARELHYSPRKVTQIINSCVALHNICVKHKIVLNTIDNVITNENVEMAEVNETNNSNYNEGERIRRTLLNNITT